MYHEDGGGGRKGQGAAQGLVGTKKMWAYTLQVVGALESCKQRLGMVRPTFYFILNS